MAESDLLTFAPEGDPPPPTVWDRPWNILVVDDDEDVHRLTRMLLRDYRLDDQGLKLDSAYSSAEAQTYLLSHPDTALILLDVVMETDDAGLRLVKWIRDDWKNPMVRIILRTGQPGAAPEKKVILEYRINDYKSKTFRGGVPQDRPRVGGTVSQQVPGPVLLGYPPPADQPAPPRRNEPLPALRGHGPAPEGRPTHGPGRDR